jgi:flagellar biosynthesis chaperone FliJ
VETAEAVSSLLYQDQLHFMQVEAEEREQEVQELLALVVEVGQLLRNTQVHLQTLQLILAQAEAEEATLILVLHSAEVKALQGFLLFVTLVHKLAVK